MHVLMFGWEFPPKNQGGLGVACKGIVDGLLTNGLHVNLVLPMGGVSSGHSNLQVLDTNDLAAKKGLSITSIDSGIVAYGTPQQYDHSYGQANSKKQGKGLYGKDLFAEVHRYATVASAAADKHSHDVIHAHDWMTYPAAIEAKKRSGKPFVAHIHATEMDRTGGNPNPAVFDIEKLGLEYADQVIAVSEFTKQKIVQYYGISADKIVVVHNAISKSIAKDQQGKFDTLQKTVLFLGRMTMQKGPDYFLQAAQKVLTVEKNVKFVMAGDGDMLEYIINQAICLGIEENVVFAGFLRGDDIDKAYQHADLYVMPSISEPFGLTALEAVKNGTPVLISKQSGVSEVLQNVLKVDFWNVDDMASKIVTVLREESLHETLRESSKDDLAALSWIEQAKKMLSVYDLAINPQVS